MQLAFEHRHSMHAAHPSSSLSFEPDQEKSVSSGEARADHDDTAVGDRAQEQGRGRGKMHATTARNNAFLRYLHGVRALSICALSFRLALTCSPRGVGF